MTIQVLEAEVGVPPAPDDRWFTGVADDGAAVPATAPSRHREPAGEPERILEHPDPLQAVFDAEFVAIMLASGPWNEPQAEARTVPPRTPTRTRRDPAPGSPMPSWARLGPRRGRRRAVVGGPRRRPGPGPRSPPSCRFPVTLCLSAVTL